MYTAQKCCVTRNDPYSNTQLKKEKRRRNEEYKQRRRKEAKNIKKMVNKEIKGIKYSSLTQILFYFSFLSRFGTL